MSGLAFPAWKGGARSLGFHCSSLLLFSRQVVSDSFVTPWTAAHQASLPITISWSLLKFMSIEPVVIQPFHQVAPFSCLQSFPVSGSFPMSQLFTSGGQSIGISISTSVLPMKIQGLFSLGLTGLISLQSKGLLESSPAPQFKSINFSVLSLPYGPNFTSIHDYQKNDSIDYMDLCQQGGLCYLTHCLGLS